MAFIPEQPEDGSLHFSANNWTGYVQAADFERENKIIPLAPSPPGIYGQLEGLLVFLMAKKLMETDKGQARLKEIIVKYLDTTGEIITSLHKSSMAHPLTAVMNNHTAISVYNRLGIMTSHDALQEKAWVDHVLGELLKAEYVDVAKQILQGITSLAEGSKIGGSKGLGLLANLKGITASPPK